MSETAIETLLNRIESKRAIATRTIAALRRMGNGTALIRLHTAQALERRLYGMALRVATMEARNA